MFYYESVYSKAHGFALQIKNLSAMEVNIVRPFVGRALQAFYKHGSPDLVPNPETVPNRWQQPADPGQKVCFSCIIEMYIKKSSLVYFSVEYYIQKKTFNSQFFLFSSALYGKGRSFVSENRHCHIQTKRVTSHVIASREGSSHFFKNP